jgi:hypothetical protein
MRLRESALEDRSLLLCRETGNGTNKVWAGVAIVLSLALILRWGSFLLFGPSVYYLPSQN